MCLIVTLIMLVLSVQNLIEAHWIIGGIQLLISLGFLILLLRNIQKARCDRGGHCDSGCMLTGWIAKYFPKKDKKKKDS